jgi:acyl carrier protein
MHVPPVSDNRPRAASDEVALLVRTVLAERFRRPLEQITPETRLVADLGVDSLDMIEVNIVLEERLHVVMPQAALPDEINVQTVGEYADLVVSRLADASAEGRAER